MKRLKLLTSLALLGATSAYASGEALNADNITSAQVSRTQAFKTYTYVRCWYRPDATRNDVTTDWEWALDSRGRYYKLYGYWWSPVSFKNMFYTDVSQSTIMQRCKETLGMDHATADIMFYAADHRFSYNHTIWSNDAVFQPTTINKLVVFGDSLSDTGNMYNGSQWLLPNRYSWFLGHFSNGFVWSEYVAKEKDIPVYNWAVGGAAGNNQYAVLTGVKDQIESYLVYRKIAKNYQAENTLYAMMFGANDFMSYDRTVAEVEADYIKALTRLIDSGAKNILLLTLPDITKAPQFNYSSEEQKAQIKDKVVAFNQFIYQQANSYPELNIMLFDVYDLFEKVTETPEKYGFEVASESCLHINRNTLFDYKLSHPLTNKCAYYGADKFVFWEVTHPTTAMHKLMADELIKASAGIFEF